jgi:hypothetical protein
MGVGVIEDWHNSAITLAAGPVSFKALKSEIRSPKSETNSKGGNAKNSKTTVLGVVSSLWPLDFGLRISDLDPSAPDERLGQKMRLLSIAAIGNPFAGR